MRRYEPNLLDGYLEILRAGLPYAASTLAPAARLSELGLDIDSVDLFRLLTRLSDHLGTAPGPDDRLTCRDLATPESLRAALTRQGS